MDPRLGLPSSPRPFNSPTSSRPIPPTPPTCPPPLPPRAQAQAAQQLAPPSPVSANSATTPVLSDSPRPAPPASLASPLPPRLSLTTTFPELAPPLASATDALAPRPDDLQNDPELPTYAHLQSQEVGNPRFGRWKGWIEKRARERKDEREAMREAGVHSSSGWDLPGVAGEGGEPRSSAELSFEDSETRARDARAEQRLARQDKGQRAATGIKVTNPDPPSSNPSFAAANTSAERELQSAAMSPSSSLLGKGRVQDLTKSIGIHPLGGRFAKGVEGNARTGCLLPNGGGANVGGDRFMLIGTDDGLNLLDLNPGLSHTTPLRTSAAPSLAEASLHPLWTGLGVLQLEVILDHSTPTSSTTPPAGLVVGLVKPEGGEAELRMWSLAALSNLARWRVFNESSAPLDLSSLPLAGASPTTSTEGKRSSRAYIKSLFSSTPTSPTDTKGKGKGKARATAGSVAIPTPLRESMEEEGDFVVLGGTAGEMKGHSKNASSASSTLGADGASTPADSETRFLPASQPAARLSSDSLRPSSISSSFGRTTPTPTSPSNSNLSLPLEWATSSLRFPLPKGAGPILFFTLCRTPPSGVEEHPRREPGIRERRRERERRERGRVWLMIATPRTVYLYESMEGGQRRWTLKREFYAPATPKQLTLIRALPPHGPHSPPPLGRRDSRTKGKRSSSPPATTDASDDLPTDLALFLTMRTKAVLINLVDSSVREVALPSSSSSFSPSGSAHARSASTLQTASSLTARAMEVGKSKVSALVEGKQGIPAGMRGEGGGLVKGKKVGEDGAVVGGGSGGEAGGGGDWVGCQMLSLILPGGVGRKDVLLLTKGSTSFVYSSPLPSFSPSLAGSSSSTASTATSSPSSIHPPTLPNPLATFSFPLTSSSPLVGLTPLLRQDLKPQYHAQGLQHLVLTAWTRSGVHVKEGIVDPLGAERGGRAGGRWFTPLDDFEKKVGESPLLSPAMASQHTVGPEATEQSDKEELEGQASLDYGRQVLQLCVGGSPHTQSSTARPPPRDSASDSDDDDESEFGDGRRARSEEEEVRQATEGGVFLCVRGMEDWVLKWAG